MIVEHSGIWLWWLPLKAFIIEFLKSADHCHSIGPQGHAYGSLLLLPDLCDFPLSPPIEEASPSVSSSNL